MIQENIIREAVGKVYDIFFQNDKPNDYFIDFRNDSDKIKYKNIDELFSKYSIATEDTIWNIFPEYTNYINDKRYKNKNKEEIIANISDQIYTKINAKELTETSTKKTYKLDINELKNKNLTKELKIWQETYTNILFKGVPGTGKSRIIDKIINDKLQLNPLSNTDNILRVNIHSASSNADLMQGIGITTTTHGQVAYKEKQGLIYEHIRKACYSPNQPFVLILEEIQENSLNELIGDLIYLIEPSKRLQLDKLQAGLSDEMEIPYLGDDGLITKYINNVKNHNKENNDDEKLSVHSVKIPFLVETSTKYRELILPNNLYIFCTSNYRDDKKVIEDNLLRRFEVYELYPQYEKAYKDTSHHISKYLKALNTVILDTFKDEEIHPDRFQIGHANWLPIIQDDYIGFYKSLLKVIVEFKEIKEIEFEKLWHILKTIELEKENNWVKKLHQELIQNIESKEENYKTLIDTLQDKAYSDLFEV